MASHENFRCIQDFSSFHLHIYRDYIGTLKSKEIREKPFTNFFWKANTLPRYLSHLFLLPFQYIMYIFVSIVV